MHIYLKIWACAIEEIENIYLILLLEKFIEINNTDYIFEIFKKINYRIRSREINFFATSNVL